MVKSAYPNCRIFYLDDDSDDREILFDAAHALVQYVQLYEEPEKLIHELQDEIDFRTIVIVDLGLHAKLAVNVISEIAAINNRQITIVAYSMSPSPEMIEDCWEAGASVYLVKPNNFPDLKQMLKKICSMDWDIQQFNREDFILK